MPMNSKATPINSELAGQVAVVTGGGRGIGRAIAARLGAAGVTTAILARSASEIEETARTIEQSGGRARPFAADVTDAAAVAKALQEIERSLGPVAVLVNNAAIPGPIGPFWETDVEQWWRTLEDRKSTRLNSSHSQISYAVFCLKKKTISLDRTLISDVENTPNPLYPRPAKR